MVKMSQLDNFALEQLEYLDHIVDELKKRSFADKELAFPVLCTLRLRNALQSVRLLTENGFIHDAMGALRSALELVVTIVGFYRIKDFKIRKHLDYLTDKKGLLKIRIETNNYMEGENEQLLQDMVKEIDKELKDNKDKGIEPFKDIHTIADRCGMVTFKKRFYKLLCMNTHPATNTLSKYADDSTPVKLIEKPEENNFGHISEGVYNCIILAASILDENLHLGTNLPKFDELLATT